MSQKTAFPNVVSRAKVNVRVGLARTADGQLVSRQDAHPARAPESYGNDPNPARADVHGSQREAITAAREKIQGSLAKPAALHRGSGSAVDVVVVDLELPSLGLQHEHALKEFAEKLPVLLLSAQREQYEQRARSLLQAYPLPDPLGDEHLANYREELLARQRYLQNVSCWTSKDVADAARHVNKNASSTANRWKSEGKIFAIPAAGKRDVYPAFQFQDGKPRAVIAELLKILEGARTPWEIAQWFIASNSWLDGDSPADLLDDPDSRDLLLDAATQEVATNVG